MFIMRRLVGVFCVAVLLATGCSSQDVGRSSDQEALEQQLSELQTAIKDEDVEAVEALTRSFIPDEESLKVALQDDDLLQVMTSRYEEAFERYDEMTDEEKLDVFNIDADQTEIIVQSATTEELIAANDGGEEVEFPGGAIDDAAALKPGVTFYEADFLKPGKTSGLVLHMFYHDGQDWRMLGKFWQDTAR